MVSLEQVKLLESKVTSTIEYVKRVTAENTKLKEKLDSYQKRIEELEVLVHQFKENQGRIEDGILSALDKLNQFEDALESKLSVESRPIIESKPPVENKPTVGSKPTTESKPIVENKPPIENKPTTESKPDIKSGPSMETKAKPPEKTIDEEETSDTADGELDIF